MHVKIKILSVLFLAVCIAGCKKWDDHARINNRELNMTLFQVISEHPKLTKFHEYLKKTGLDKELASSKSYTVWAPQDAALQNLDPAVIADSTRLRRFIANHISNETYFYRNSLTPIRVLMLNGKRVTYANGRLDDANIVEADRFVSNGVLEIMDKAVPAYSNAWEMLNETKTTFRQNAFILSLTRNVFDPTNAIIDSINSQTGQPVYRPGTDSVLRNTFNANVADLENEDKQYTYFILHDTAFNTEVNKLTPYFKTGTADSTNNLAANAVVKDLVVEGVYSIDQLPATLVSKFGVTIPIDKNRIIETRRLSNGIAYVLSGLSFNPKSKIPSIIVQAEQYLAFLNNLGEFATPRQNNTSAVFRRARVNPITSQPFTDVFIYNHGISGLSTLYRAADLSSVKYKVYWVAVNDTLIVDRGNRVNPALFRQRLAMGSRTSTTFPLIDVPVNNYNEVYIGDYTQQLYGSLFMFLTANGTSSLTLDYIKLVPDL
jgi:hypothetical protein